MPSQLAGKTGNQQFADEVRAALERASIQASTAAKDLSRAALNRVNAEIASRTAAAPSSKR